MCTERELLTELGRVRKEPQGMRVIHLFSSWTSEDPGFQFRRTEAMNILKDCLSTRTSFKLFTMENGDIIAICAQIASSSILSMLTRVQAAVFGDRLPKKNIYDEISFYKIFDASRELNRLIDGVRAMVAQGEKKNSDTRQPIDAGHLQAVTEMLRKSDIRSMIFNQPVYFTAHPTPSIDFLEFYVALPKLEDRMCPGYSLSANPWLFNLVKSELDRALMRSLQNEIGSYRHKAFSLNAQISTFLSSDFEAFIKAMPTKLIGRIYVELDKADVIQHSDQMSHLAERSRQLSVPLCIDGLSHHDLRYLKLSNIGAEYLKIRWSSDMECMSMAEVELFCREIKANCERKIVLNRCDSPRAIAFARTLGVGFIQGRLADKFFKFGADMAAA